MLGLLLLLPGCPLSPDKDDGGGDPDDTREIPRDSVRGALARLEQVWEQKDFRGYEDLLHTGFRFYIRDDEASDFPWLPNPYWGRTEELDFASNMFDTNFTGENPPVQSIEWEFNVLNEVITTDVDGESVTEVTADAIITVLTGPSDGWRSDTRFIFDVIADPDEEGLFQIKRQAEVLKL
ncbi:MAG TPA: hypothetical protein VKU85_16620 [bacterium]|nr:hypothetical protein [bacterium]